MAKRRVKKARLRRAPRKAGPAYRDYAARLRDLFRAQGAALKAAILEQWPKWLADAAPLQPSQRSDVSLHKEIRLVLDGVRAEFRIADKARGASEEQGQRVDRKNRDNTNAQAKSLLGVEPFAPSDQAAQDMVSLFVEGNTGLITGVSETQAQQIGQIVQDNLISGLSAAQTAKEIAERIDVSESRAIFIARDQTAKLNAQMSAMRLGRIGIASYEWSTSKDERVRASHAAHDGNVYRFDDPPEPTGNPGDDYNCRCVAIPVFDDSEDNPDSEG